MRSSVFKLLQAITSANNVRNRKALAVIFILCAATKITLAQTHTIEIFQRHQLTDVYYSEGIGAGDLNRDGHADIVYGPYWFAGPEFKSKYEIYEPVAQPREKYANHFFAWVYDFNADGWNDILTAGFPGTPGYVYENPGQTSSNVHWKKHEVVSSVSNESPHFTNLVGDATPEMVCSQAGFFGYAAPDPQHPLEAWKFVPISEKVAPVPFGHGLGVGDVNGDKRLDLLTKDGWYEQPVKIDVQSKWEYHPFLFTKAGGADMVAYDVDGDGDNDVITSLTAHDFGLAWFEQIQRDDKISFRQHLIMGQRPEENAYGLVFSELHSLNLFDIDGDGLKDIVTGKTYWSHHTKSPMWDAGAVVVWFKLIRTPNGVDWRPFEADRESGIGRQLVVTDITQDGIADILAGGMKGAHWLGHSRKQVSQEQWQIYQPKKLSNHRPVIGDPKADSATFQVPGACEGESLKVLQVSGGTTSSQQMSAFSAGRWSGDQQLFWRDLKAGDQLALELNVQREGDYEVLAAFTKARDYGIVRIKLDDEKLGSTIDLFDGSKVISTGELPLGKKKLSAGVHRVTIEAVGANPMSSKPTMFGLDYIRLKP